MARLHCPWGKGPLQALRQGVQASTGLAARGTGLHRPIEQAMHVNRPIEQAMHVNRPMEPAMTLDQAT